VSPQLDAIVLKAMAKGAANRYQSAAEMRMDIVRVLSGQRPSAPMVMSDEDRTSMMGQTRTNDIPRGRHRPDAMVDDYDDYDDGEEERKRKRRKAWITAVVTLLVVAVVVLGIWLVTSLVGNKGASQDIGDLPTVKGVTETAARKQLQDAGFSNVSIKQVNCEPGANGAPAPCTADQVNSVIDQDPPAGKVVKTNAITLTVGRSASQVKVPDVKGKSKDDASAQLTQAGFLIAPEDGSEEVPDTKLVGKVSSTTPAANAQAPKGSTVKLNIGKVQAQQTVTNVTGQDFTTAQSNLQSDGWTVTRQDVESDQPAGTVVDYTPKKAKPGSAITVKVSKGSQNQATIDMPNLIGLKKQAAIDLLRSKGWDGQFNVTEVAFSPDMSDKDEVVEQQPDANSKIAKNQAINVNIASKLPGSG
jgi:serine/threonine-protein kinase